MNKAEAVIPHHNCRHLVHCLLIFDIKSPYLGVDYQAFFLGYRLLFRSGGLGFTWRKKLVPVSKAEFGEGRFFIYEVHRKRQGPINHFKQELHFAVVVSRRQRCRTNFFLKQRLNFWPVLVNDCVRLMVENLLPEIAGRLNFIFPVHGYINLFPHSGQNFVPSSNFA